MTEISEPLPQPDKASRHQMVLRYFLEKQSGDATFLPRVIRQLEEEWDGLPSAQRDAIAAAQRLLQPEDLRERERSTRAFLLAAFLINEMYNSDDLEKQLELPASDDTSSAA